MPVLLLESQKLSGEIWFHEANKPLWNFYFIALKKKSSESLFRHS